jgi:phosphonoacetate hydrolase
MLEGEVMRMVQVERQLCLVIICAIVAGCSGGDKVGNCAGCNDASPDTGVKDSLEGQAEAIMSDIHDLASVDGVADDVDAIDSFDLTDDMDVGLFDVMDSQDGEADVDAPLCLEQASPGSYLSTESVVEFVDQGVNQWEMTAYETAAAALLQDESVWFVSTYLFDEGIYKVTGKSGWLTFSRTFGPTGPEFVILEEDGDTPFECTDSAAYNTYADELTAGSNPHSTQYPDLGYEPDDPRISFIAPTDHCYPQPLARIAQLFDADNAPDFHYGLAPSGVGSGGSHGALDVLQSRAPLVVSGMGIKKGFDDAVSPQSVDLAPTVLYLMGADYEAGLKHGVEHDSTYLKWQDGDVLTQMKEDGCVEPFQFVFIFLFDGLQSNELVHLYEDGEAEYALPAFSAIMDNGTVFRNGALVGFPSVSVPGHLSVGTGMLNGHHNFINNGFYYRVDELLLSPGDIIAQAEEYAAEPEKAVELFNYVMNPLGETIFQAAHRHFGDDVFTASVNELTLTGADHNLVDMARALAPDERSDYFELADSLAMPQVLGLLDEHQGTPNKMLFFTSYYTTDHAGEHAGPHGDELRETLVKLDGHLQIFLKRLDDHGIRDKSLIIITADHGMETQDQNQTGAWKTKLAESGVKYIDPDGFGCVYLPAMKVTCEVNFLPATYEYVIAVSSDDTGLPVSNAVVTLDPSKCASEQTCSGITDQTGTVLLGEGAMPVLPISLTITHESYNAASIACE